MGRAYPLPTGRGKRKYQKEQIEANDEQYKEELVKGKAEWLVLITKVRQGYAHEGIENPTIITKMPTNSG